MKRGETGAPKRNRNVNKRTGRDEDTVSAIFVDDDDDSDDEDVDDDVHAVL